MAITNLTNTTWVLKDSIIQINDGNSYHEFHINFTSNGTNYELLEFHFWSDRPGRYENYVGYYDGIQEVNVCAGDQGIQMIDRWTNQAYRIISITGGTDATSSGSNFATLLSWLQSNAAQVPVIDLTNTEWIFNSTVSVPAFSYSLNYDVKDSHDGVTKLQTAFNCNNVTFKPDPQDDPVVIWYLQGTNTTGTAPSVSNVFGTGTANTISYWSIDDRKISIIGGTDATNPDLISWLSQNASYQEPVQVNTYTLTHSLTHLAHGNFTIKITPDNGYAYPSIVTVSNGTLVSYDNTKGEAVINGNDTTIVSGECESQPSGYSVSVYSDINDSDILVDVYDGQNNSGIYLGTLSSYQTGNYIITSGYIYVEKALSPIMTPGIVYFNNTGGLNTLPISSDTSLTVISGPGPF